MEDEGHCWYLPPDNFRVYGLPLSLLPTSIEIHSHHSKTSTVDMPYLAQTISNSLPREVLPVLPNNFLLQIVKVEALDTIIILSSESEGESPNLTL